MPDLICVDFFLTYITVGKCVLYSLNFREEVSVLGLRVGKSQTVVVCSFKCAGGGL